MRIYQNDGIVNIFGVAVFDYSGSTLRFRLTYAIRM